MASTYSPQQFGRLIGRSVKTLQKWDREGTLTAHRSPTNRRYYTHEQYLTYRGLTSDSSGKTIVYARVSRAGQKADMSRQVTALRGYCDQHHYHPDEWIEEIGSGLNYRREQFNRVLEDVELGQVRRLIIAHNDRFVRFGFDWFAAFCERHGADLIIINGDTLSPEQELVDDFLATVQVFSARLDGLRSCQRSIREAVRTTDDHQPQHFQPESAE